MSDESAAVLDVVRRYIETYNMCTPEFAESCVTDDYQAVGFPGGEVLVAGRNALRVAAERMFTSPTEPDT